MGTLKQITLTARQSDLIMAMFDVNEACGWDFLCAACERASTGDLERLEIPGGFSLRCGCSERNAIRKGLKNPRFTSHLIPVADDVLTSVGLVLRCKQRVTDCRTTPLTIRDTGETMTIRCPCSAIDPRAIAIIRRGQRPMIAPVPANRLM